MMLHSESCGGRPLPCLEVADQMIQVAPVITWVGDHVGGRSSGWAIKWVGDQLLGLKLITKSSSERDRRVYDSET